MPPTQLLEDLRGILLKTFRSEFESDAQRKDEQAVSRFFRLWPGIGAEEEGLEAYGDFVVGLVKARSSSAGKRTYRRMKPDSVLIRNGRKLPRRCIISLPSPPCWSRLHISSTSISLW